ncbi:MAG: glycosyl transferase, family 2, partial [Candidatus Solibacter sp.]|nr:glycosyl transferase, family 2 [Candidatus Solibacter sp.]
FEGLGAGRHVFLIHVTGESRREAQGTFVDLDALAVK